MPKDTHKARFWILTVPHHCFTPYLPDGVKWISGQLEQGAQGDSGNPVDLSSLSINAFGPETVSMGSGFLHWQFVVAFATQVRLSTVRKVFGPYHAEPTKSSNAERYCHKVDTRVEGTEFTLGSRPVKRGDSTDWASVLDHVKSGEHGLIPPDIYVRYFGNIERIGVKYSSPVALLRTCYVFHGATGTGKSKLAWSEAGLDAYPKDPMSKFWDGYCGQDHVVIDEFRGAIAISHILRWLDRYPVLVEVKGSSAVLKASKVWITSNVPPHKWYPDLDPQTQDALFRRLIIKEFFL